MLSEILKVIPKIDPADAAKMATSLGKNTAKIGTVFSKSIRASLTGGFAGWGNQLIQKILNPVEDIEKKMKDILASGKGTVESAARFGTNAGDLARAQAGAQQLGIAPEKFNALLESFAKSVETARRELADPTATPSAATLAVRQFIGEPDLLKSFQAFAAAQSAVASGPGRVASFGSGPMEDRVKRFQTGAESQRQIQEAVFGEQLHGSAARIGQLGGAIGNLGGPTSDQLNAALMGAARGNDRLEAASAVMDLKNIVTQQAAISDKAIQLMLGREEAQAKADLASFQRFEVLAQASQDIQAIKNFSQQALSVGAQVVGLLGKVVNVTEAWASKSGVAGWIGEKIQNGLNSVKGSF